MLRVVTINKSELDNRFESRFHYNKKRLEKSFKKYGFVTIEEISKLKSGTTPEHNEEKKNKDDVFFIKSADVKRFGINLKTVSFISLEKHKKQKNSKIISNDILLTNTGKYMGFCSLISEDIKEANINQNIIRIRLNEKEDRINPYILTAFLNSKFGQIEIESILTLTGQKYLSSTKFYDFKVPIIPENIAKYITDQIKKIYELDDKSIKLIEKARSIVYNDLNINFDKIPKDNFYSVKLSELNEEDLWIPKYKYPLYIKCLEEIKSKFKTTKLSSIVKIVSGNEAGSDNYLNLLNAKDNSVPFIRTTDLVNYEADIFSDFLLPKEIAEIFSQDILLFRISQSLDISFVNIVY